MMLIGRGQAERPVRGTPRRATLHVPAQLLVLAWFGMAGLVALGHRTVPASGWLMVHLLLLGGVSTAILLWSQHFAETLLRRPAPGGRRGLWARLLGWSGGAALVAAGVVRQEGPLVVAGALVLAAVAIAHVAVLALQRRGSARLLGNRFAHLVRYYLAATAVLPVGVALGVVLARVPAGPAVQGRLYVAHLAATLLGWVGLTVAGTVVLLWPTVLRIRLDAAADRDGRRALVLLAVGLAVVLAGPASGARPLVGVGVAVVTAGLLMLGRPVVAQGVAAARVHGTGSFAAASIAASLVWFLVSVLAFGWVVVSVPWAAAPGRLAGLVAPFAVGFVAQVMIGSTSYLLPVVLGGGPGAVRWSTAAMDRGGAWRLVVLNLALAAFLLPAPSAVRVAVSALGLLPLLAFVVIAARTVAVRRWGRERTLEPERPGDPGTPHWRPGPVAGGATAGVAAVVLAVAAGVALDPAAAHVTTVPTSVARGAAEPDRTGGTGGTGGTVAATGRTTTVTVTMRRMRFSPDVVEVAAGDRLVLELVNADDQVHDLVLADGTSSRRLAAGERTTVDAGVVRAGLDGWCSVAGHRLMGMTLRVVLAGSDPGAATTAAPHEHDGSAEPSAAGDVDLMAEPGDGWEPPEAVLPPAATSGTDRHGTTTEPDPDGTGWLHRVTLRVTEQVVEVAPGVRQTRWTFGGSAPGPALRGRVGDTFVVTLENDGTIGHSVDFHAGALAPDEPMRTIGPGERLTYTFRAERSGIWMYHCATMPMSLHIANGMFGAVVVDPPDLAPVDRELLLVQSELYLGPQGGAADPEHLAAQQPDLVVLNGYANAYRYAPLRARTGERVRIWVLDAGPNRPSSFHVVGGQFDTVFAEGAFLLRDGGPTGTGGAQALALQPAQGGFVELELPEAGHYSAVTHVMGDAERGGQATIEVTDH